MTPEQARVLAIARARLATSQNQPLTFRGVPLSTTPADITRLATPAGGAAPQRFAPAPASTGPVGATHGVYDPRMGVQGDTITPEQRELAAQLAPGQLAAAGQGLTFNFGDEIAGLIGGVGNMIGGADHRFSTGYNANRDAYNADLGFAQQNDPGGTGFAGAMGTVANAGALGASGISFLAGAKPTVPSVLGRTAAEGATYGALAGAGEGDTLAERVAKAAEGAGTGAALGVAMGIPAGGAVARMARQATPATSDLRDTAVRLYGDAAAAGTTFSGDYLGDVLNQVVTDAARAGASSGLPRSWAILNNTIAGNTGESATLETIEGLRRQIVTAQRGADEGEMSVLTAMKHSLDNAIVSAPDGAIIAGDRSGIGTMQQARNVYATAARAADVDTALSRAQNAANPNTAVRDEFRRLANDDLFMNGLNDNERTAIYDVVRGTPTEKTLRTIGAFMGNSGSAAVGALASLLGYSRLNNYYAAGGLGAVAAAATRGAGAAATGQANRLLNANATLAGQVVRNSGYFPPVDPLIAALTRQALGANADVTAASLPPYGGGR